MCIIADAKTKGAFPRENVIECMRSNSAGFFMAELLPGGGRRAVRTLSQDELLGFFDSVPDDHPVVLHARIPSVGEKTLDNVHGWEEDGVVFCHNMTMSNLSGLIKRDGWKGTDSEYFFRKIFIPLYRAFGGSAYNAGKLHPDLERVVEAMAGTSNRFLFVMPDNVVLKYGDGWVTDFGGQVAFSNNSYKIFSRSWSGTAGCWSNENGYWTREYGSGGYYGGRPSEPAKAEPAKAEPAKAEPAKAEPAKAEPAKGGKYKSPAEPPDFDLVRAARLALAEYAICNAIAVASDTDDYDVAEVADGLLPVAWGSRDTYGRITLWMRFPKPFSKDSTDEELTVSRLKSWAYYAELDDIPDYGRAEHAVATVAKLLNLAFDWNAKTPADAIRMYRVGPKGLRGAKPKLERVPPDELLAPRVFGADGPLATAIKCAEPKSAHVAEVLSMVLAAARGQEERGAKT